MKIIGILLVAGCALYAGYQIAIKAPAFGADYWLVCILVTLGTLLIIND